MAQYILNANNYAPGLTLDTLPIFELWNSAEAVTCFTDVDTNGNLYFKIDNVISSDEEYKNKYPKEYYLN